MNLKLFFALFLLATLESRASDITRNTTLSDGGVLYASDLHSLIDDSSISTTFISGKVATSSLSAGDSLILYDGTQFKKISGSVLLYGNTTYITSQAEKAVPTSADYFVVYDAAGNALKKVSFANSVLGTNLISAQGVLVSSNVTLQARLLVLNGATNGAMTLSNLFLLNNYSSMFTNLTTHVAPTNQDSVLVWSSVFGTNVQIPLVNVFSNAQRVTTFSNSDVFTFISITNGQGGTNPSLSTVTYTNLKAGITSSLYSSFIPGRFATVEYAVSNSTAAQYISTNHGLSSTPQLVRWVLVCKTNELGFVVGDEVDCTSIVNGSDNSKHSQFGVNSTNIFWSFSANGANLQLLNRTNPIAPTALADSANLILNWKLKGYATLFP